VTFARTFGLKELAGFRSGMAKARGEGASVGSVSSVANLATWPSSALPNENIMNEGLGNEGVKGFGCACDFVRVAKTDDVGMCVCGQAAIESGVVDVCGCDDLQPEASVLTGIDCAHGLAGKACTTGSTCLHCLLGLFGF